MDVRIWRGEGKESDGIGQLGTRWGRTAEQPNGDAGSDAAILGFWQR